MTNEVNSTTTSTTNTNTKNTLSHLKSDVNRLHVSFGLHLKSAKEDAEAMLSVQERIGSGAEYRKWHRTNLDHTISKAEEAGAIFSFKEPARFHGLRQAFPHFSS